MGNAATAPSISSGEAGGRRLCIFRRSSRVFLGGTGARGFDDEELVVNKAYQLSATVVLYRQV